MIFLIDCSVKSTLTLGLMLLLLRLVPKYSAATRHWILASATLCVAITPMAALVLPSWSPVPWLTTAQAPPVALLESSRIATKGDLGTSTPDSSKAVAAEPLAPAIPQDLLKLIWLTGLSISCFVLLTGTARVAWLAQRSRPVVIGAWARIAGAISREYSLRRRVSLLQSPNKSILVTWGVLRPRILLPVGAQDWPDDRIHAVLCHELAHVRRGDWLVQMTAQVLRSIYWFNPLMWVLCSRLRLESEYACDDAVLAQGITSSAYAGHLLDIVALLQQSHAPGSAALAMARLSTIERRFKTMLNPTADHRPISRLMMFAIGIIAVCVTLPFAGFSSTAPPQGAVRGITGAVMDVTGARVPGATIVVSSPDGQTRGTATANASGAFVLNGLPTGSCVLQVFATGFGPSRMINLDLPPNGILDVEVRMDIGFVQRPAPSVPSKVEYTGEIVTIHVQDLDIKEFFQLIESVSGLKVEVDPAVSGVISVNLKDVPWDQMLDEVLQGYQLKHDTEGGIIRITRNIAAIQKTVPELQQAQVTVKGPQRPTCEGASDLRTFSRDNGGLSLKVVSKYLFIGVQRRLGYCS